LSLVFVYLVVAVGLINSLQLFISPKHKYSTYTYKEITNSKNYGNLIDFLIRNDFTVGFIDYWDQWNINFISGERLRFAALEFGPYWKNRYFPYWEDATNNSNSVFVYDYADIDARADGTIPFSRSGYYYALAIDFIIFYKR